MIRNISIGIAGFGAVLLLIHLVEKLGGHGEANASDAMAILVLAMAVRVIGSRRGD